MDWFSLVWKNLNLRPWDPAENLWSNYSSRKPINFKMVLYDVSINMLRFDLLEYINMFFK